jgi:ABC-2 type transport system permease protein
MMRIRKALIVFDKDWRDIRRNWEVMAPIIIVPVLISLVIPLIVTLTPGSLNSNLQGSSFLENILNGLPSQLKAELAGLNETQIIKYVMLLYFFAPFFLIIPIMASSVIASDSFAGEKERKTIEALLATPLTDSELLLGKILVSFVPAMIVTVVSFLVYSLVIDLLTFNEYGWLLLPTLSWLLLIFGMAPAIALLGIGVSVIISAKVKGFREAQQISALLVLPVLVLLFGQATGSLILGPIVVSGLTMVLLLLDLIVFRVSVHLFRREEIIITSK